MHIVLMYVGVRDTVHITCKSFNMTMRDLSDI